MIPEKEVNNFVQGELTARFPDCTLHHVSEGTDIAELTLGTSKRGIWPWRKSHTQKYSLIVEKWEDAAIELAEDDVAVATVDYELYLGHDEFKKVVAWWTRVVNITWYDR